MTTLGEHTSKRLRDAMDDDLNTAQAQAAIFDMIRAVNSAMDAGDVKSGDVAALLAPLEQFDQIFSVLQDDDTAQMQRICEWAKAEGREKDVSPELEEIIRSASLTDSQIDAKVEQMIAARKARDFATSDKIRAELVAQGILIEQTKEGVRWRRK
jgi:cysteinyl-tRNA synthetase